MSKAFKSQASSARVAPNFTGFSAFQTAASPLSYITEQPDLAQINDPHVVVSLKNLSKKDSTTKAKALDELLESLKENTDKTVLTTWSDLYPRTSIDNSQIVRRSAHTLQGILTSNSGKKIVPFLPKIVPSWLAGTFDSDKSVARAAAEALDKSFATKEKKEALWKIYHDAILGHVEDAVLVQTATTLSDERTTSADEAESKYVRVVGTAVHLLGQLVTKGLGNHEILQDKKLWGLVYHDDAYLRTSICSLLRAVLQKGAGNLDWILLSTCFLYKGLNKSQMGSSQAFVSAVYDLSRAHPSVWTSDYTAKSAVSKRLLNFLRQGSQNGPAGVWSILVSWFESAVPIEAWKQCDEDCNVLADAYRTGVLQERINTDAAWASYVDLSAFLLGQLQNQEARDTFAERNLLPVVTSCITASTDEKWRIGLSPENTARRALLVMAGKTDSILRQTWLSCTDSTIEKMRLSLPESSRDFRKSQDAAAAQAKRLLNLQKGVTPREFISDANRSLLYSAIDLLKSRNGKPYGAALIIEELVGREGINDNRLKEFVEKDIISLLDSPSSVQLVSLAMTFKITIGPELLSGSKSPNIIQGTEYFLRNAPEASFEDLHVCDLILSNVGNFGTDVGRAFALSVLANSQLSSHNLRFQILSKLTQVLASSTEAQNGLTMLEVVLSQPVLAQEISSSQFGSQLATKLLLLADSDASIADRASAITAALNSSEQSPKSSLPIIKQQLSGEGDSLSVLTLTELGLKSFDHVNAEELLPTFQDWQTAFQPHFDIETQRSLSITSPLRGAVWTIEPGVQRTPLTGVIWSKESPKIVRDAEEFSQLFRITFFVVKVFRPNISKLNAISSSTKTTSPVHCLFQWLPAALELINEKLTLDNANGIWLGSTDEVLQAASDVLSEGLSIVASWFDNEAFVNCWLDTGSRIEETDRCSYICALAFQRILTNIFDLQKSKVLQKFSSTLDSIHKSSNTVQSSALLSALGVHILNGPSGLKTVNELISHVTHSQLDFPRLVLLNILLAGDAVILAKVPQQRLVFLFKSLLSQIEEPHSVATLSESLFLASMVVMYVQDIYGDHWEKILQGLIDIWSTIHAGDVSLIYSSLQTYSALKLCLDSEEVNDDLQDAWSAGRKDIYFSLLRCLEALSTTSASVDQPRAITAEFLRRKLVDIEVPAETELFGLLSSGLVPVRQAAYDLLHRSIPERQEELSIDLALEQKLAELPKPLLHLIDDSTDAQRYLLAWKLTFDHYPKASHKLREAYSTNLKSSGCVSKLLNFLCEKLRIASGRPIDASKFDIKNYNAELSESDDQSLQWLSIHVYYLLLMYVPHLVKDWYLEQKNRIKLPLETWTQKYMSPLIISSSLAAVEDWSSAQRAELSEEDRPVQTKVTLTEVVASIPIDPESPAICLSVSLPPAYPLEPPSVKSRTRVGVSENKWESWLRTFSVIIFSQGIVEGLVAFRRNVMGALKGQSECAICYSIIGTDMQTPSKKCQTCKNWFHGSCLFRWFRSSNSSSCPLCRNNFNYA